MKLNSSPVVKWPLEKKINDTRAGKSKTNDFLLAYT